MVDLVIYFTNFKNFFNTSLSLFKRQRNFTVFYFYFLLCFFSLFVLLRIIVAGYQHKLQNVNLSTSINKGFFILKYPFFEHILTPNLILNLCLYHILKPVSNIMLYK